LASHGQALASVLYAEMVGYEEIQKKSPELANFLLRKYEDILKRAASSSMGKIVEGGLQGGEATGLKTWLSGPKKVSSVRSQPTEFIVKFPDSLAALKCAEEVHRSVKEYNDEVPKQREFLVRIAVHSGDLLRSDGEPSGEAVKVASSVLLLSKPGSTYVTKRVFDELNTKGEYSFRRVEDLPSEIAVAEVYVVESARSDSRSSRQGYDRNRLAVLPMISLSPDPTDGYFADGMTEELIATISKVKELSVISRTSVMQYKGREKIVSEIGRELSVGTILEGSVRKAGNKVRITVQLIDVNEDKHLWAQSYDRSLEDVFAVQSDIARCVADSLKVELLEEDRSGLGIAPKDPQAYLLYLKGRYYWSERTKESLRKAMNYFRKAIEKDADFALAYAGLADTYNVILDRGYNFEGVTFKEGKNLAIRALEIDNSLAEAHLALAGICGRGLEFELEERELKKAIELNPSLAQAHHWLATHYMTFGRWNQAIDELKKALELDPLNGHVKGLTAYVLVMAERYDEAIDLGEESIREYPEGFWGHLALGYVHLKRLELDKALEEAAKAVQLYDHPWPVAFLACVLRDSGKLEEARKLASKYLSELDSNAEHPVGIAMVYLGMNENDKAFELLNEAYERRDPGLNYVGFPPPFDLVKSDPRYLDLIKKIGHLGFG
jgi:adenylate cyclase